MFSTAIAEGEAKGWAKGIVEGEAKGLAKGLARGIQQGAEQRTSEIARRMLARGDSPEDVADLTSLSVEEVYKLRDELSGRG